MYEIFEKGNGIIVLLDKFRFQGLFSSFFPSPSLAGRITLDKKIEKARRRERGTRETQSWSRDVERSRKKKEECTGSGRKGSRSETSGLETRVMAFLVLSCVRTLTLLAHIRA